MLKSSFSVLGAIMKYQKYSESETLHEIAEVLRNTKDWMSRLKMDWQGNKQFA